MNKHPDYPITECRETFAAIKAKLGDRAKCFQKFTCVGCGERVTIDQPNVFLSAARCLSCGELTNIELQGCNYVLAVRL